MIRFEGVSKSYFVRGGRHTILDDVTFAGTSSLGSGRLTVKAGGNLTETGVINQALIGPDGDVSLAVPIDILLAGVVPLAVDHLHGAVAHRLTGRVHDFDPDVALRPQDDGERRPLHRD